jgi:hypothetical protein
MTDTRIDVFQNDIDNKYRQIELQGSPENISRASEKIYKIVNKYYFFESRTISDDDGSREDEYRMKKHKNLGIIETSKLKRKGIRLGKRMERKKTKEEKEGKRFKSYKREKGNILI